MPQIDELICALLNQKRYYDAELVALCADTSGTQPYTELLLQFSPLLKPRDLAEDHAALRQQYEERVARGLAQAHKRSAEETQNTAHTAR